MVCPHLGRARNKRVATECVVHGKERVCEHKVCEYKRVKRPRDSVDAVVCVLQEAKAQRRNAQQYEANDEVTRRPQVTRAYGRKPTIYLERLPAFRAWPCEKDVYCFLSYWCLVSIPKAGWRGDLQEEDAADI